MKMYFKCARPDTRCFNKDVLASNSMITDKFGTSSFVNYDKFLLHLCGRYSMSFNSDLRNSYR